MVQIGIRLMPPPNTNWTRRRLWRCAAGQFDGVRRRKGERVSVSEIVVHIRAAQELATALGIPNILQPGLVKELILAEALGHTPITSKANADARDVDGRLYEYLCSLTSSNNFQMDRVTKDNRERITRNEAFYFAFFTGPVALAEVFRVETRAVLEEAERQLVRSRNDISHLNLTGAWVRRNGTRVRPGP